ncbi:MAG: TlpA family protein disulfide reductase [Saprospiraceae bacterium]|nr:TlpA family protein disulfide reductase [Saprospiraceae bacterium]MBP7680072.1 TlpA family protein disulfide reductase [Saprospiraceae bacterium]
MIKYLFIALLVVIAIAGYYYYYVPKYIRGAQAPDFSAKTIDGKTFQLSQLKGSYVLLDFWASWCPPCRAESPQMVALQQKYQGRGFEIVSIGLETNETAWRNAIAKDGLNWQYHISDFKRMASPIAELYGIKSIPTKYLINPQGTIIGVNMPYEEINNTLEARLLTK